MSEIGDYYKERHEANRKQRAFQTEKFHEKLDRFGFEYTNCTPHHFKIVTAKGIVNYWPSSSKWMPNGSKVVQIGWVKFIDWLEE